MAEIGAGLTSPSRPWLHPSRLALLGFFVALMGFTHGRISSDAYWYVASIRATMGRSWANSAEIWEFAHLLWRPLGRALASALLPWASSAVGGDTQAGITLLLVIVSVLATLVSCFLVHTFLWRFTQRPWISAFVTAAFLGFNPVLNDSREGVAYVSAFAVSLGAFYLAIFAEEEANAALGGGILSALAAAFWVPLIVSVPAVLAARPILRKQAPAFRYVAIFAISCGIALGVLFGSAMYMAHIGSVAEFRAWLRRGAAGVSGRNPSLIRMVTGLVRSMYDLGQDSVWFKWYLYHDPYAQVSLGEIFRVSLARILVFYTTIAALVFLWPLRFGRRILVVLLILAIPHLGIAMTVESGSPERYLAPLGFVAIAFGYLIANPKTNRVVSTLAAILLCAPLIFNIAEAGVGRTNREVETAVERITPLVNTPANTRVFLVSGSDSLFVLRYNAPFHPIQREKLPQIDLVMPFSRTIPWKDSFACGAEFAWSHGGEVWVTTRLLRETPRREWLWVVADSPSISWSSLHEYFAKLDQGEVRGGEDGFFKLEPTSKNREVLAERAPGSPQGACQDAEPATAAGPDAQPQ